MPRGGVEKQGEGRRAFRAGASIQEEGQGEGRRAEGVGSRRAMKRRMEETEKRGEILMFLRNVSEYRGIGVSGKRLTTHSWCHCEAKLRPEAISGFLKAIKAD